MEEAQERIARKLCQIDGYSGWFATSGNEGMTQAYIERADEVLNIIEELGYRKLLLSSYEELKYISDSEQVAKAQKEGKVGIKDEEILREQDELIDDGFGTAASPICPVCGCRAVYVCRPGDIRCAVCYDGNPRDYYTGELCPKCGLHSVHNNVCLCCKGVI